MLSEEAVSWEHNFPPFHTYFLLESRTDTHSKVHFVRDYTDKVVSAQKRGSSWTRQTNL